ncbi:MAG: glycosyltransferase family 1 protein [Candidatus Daviesbacteria bacterium]|nr:glycosyltransferase family 1 protein [Candidatus Daviesbacteria bacterium]
MRIVIDGRMFNESGVGRYIRNLINNLAILDKKNEYFILHLKEDYKNLEYQDNFRKILANFRWYGIEEQIKLSGLIKSLNPALVHFPHFNVPIRYGGKFVVTIHDLIHQHFSMERSTTHGLLVYKLKRLGYRKVFTTAINKSLAILVPSYFVKGELIKDWAVSEDKISVTHEAVDDKLFTILNEMKMEDIKSLRDKFNIRNPYLFYVGNAHPHKNVEGLIRAFGVLREKYPDLGLVLSGNDHYFWQKIRKEFQQEGVIYAGSVSDEELVGLYKGATAFVMPSLEEGFGIPILEAFACECPVISSNKGSLPEVGGDAVVYFDPASPDDMTAKISQVLDDKKLWQQLIEKGLKRYKQFSWKKLAQKTLEVYLKCV